MRAYLDDDRISIIQGEALEVMRSLPSKSFDLIVTDPPYSPRTHKNLGKERRNDGAKAREALEFPPMTPELIAEVAAQYVRLTKGWILSFADYYHTAIWGHAIEDAGGAWVRTGSWVKTNPMPQMTGDRPATGTEDILIAHASPHSAEWEWNGKGHAAVWRGPRDLNAEHPNQKPEWLLQALLGMFAPKGALVLDPYFGNGTTGAAALRTERLSGEVALETACKGCSKKLLEAYQPPLPEGVRVIGIEGDPKWGLSAAKRILALLRAS